jgi:hypothetical protein
MSEKVTGIEIFLTSILLKLQYAISAYTDVLDYQIGSVIMQHK